MMLCKEVQNQVYEKEKKYWIRYENANELN